LPSQVVEKPVASATPPARIGGPISDPTNRLVSLS
jgi:hypothetical protein